jgi:MFS family permease
MAAINGEGTHATISIQHTTDQDIEAVDVDAGRSAALPNGNEAFALNTSTEPESSTSFPPTDGGWPAWRILIAMFIFEALLWGFPLSFGVFQSYYSSLDEFKGSRFTSIIGTTASGICYLGAPIAMPLIRRHLRYRMHMICVGWPLCIIALVAGSYANQLSTLVLTQGVLYGLGFVIFYYPILTLLDEYWVRRRGMAYGIVCAASGASGAVMPSTLQALLSRFGYHSTLRAVAVALVVLTGPLIPLFKSRFHGVQQQQAVVGSLRTDWTFLRKPLFWIYSVSNILMGLGYFFPSLYLPSYATDIGLKASQGALLLTIMSVFQVLGQFTFGYISDGKRLSLDTLLAISVIVAATATFGAWGVARSLAPLLVFAAFYGFFAAGYTPMWARMVTAISEEPSTHQAMYSLFCFQKGLGNILSGPISAGLLQLSPKAGNGEVGYGHGIYKAVVIFTGVCLFMSALSLAPVKRSSRWLSG